MKTDTPKLLGLRLLTAAVIALSSTAQAATPILSFGFDEGAGNQVRDSINSLVGVPNSLDNAPKFISDSPSGNAGDSAISFESGQYMTVNDPDTRVQFDRDNPSFTLQAWVKISGQPAGRQVFFYSNGPGGAVSFSVNSDRTVFVTTLGIADVRSQAAIPDDDAWHHIAVVHQHGTEFRFYVDGALGDTVPYTSGVNFSRTQNLFSLGAEWNGALQFVGAVDRLKVSSGILSPAELDFRATPPGPLIDFGFNEGGGTQITDSINSLVGAPSNSQNPPAFITDAPSGRAGDTAIQFAAGQYMTVNDPDTRIKLDRANPEFTLQAWVKISGQPAGRQVFFYSNGPGGAISFSVNSDRTVFVTTLGIADVRSQAAIPDDEAWHHIAVVHQPGTELRFYVDGVLGDTVPYTSGVNFSRTQNLFSVGAEWNGALQFIGAVDRLKVSNEILSPGELDYQATPPATLVDFGFDEGSGTQITDSINSLVGVPSNPQNAPAFITDAPSARAGDTAMKFEAGQYMTVNDPDTRIQLNRANPAFTLQAWVKVSGQPAGRQVFFYSNGPGGAISFSVNSDRTVFVTTLGIADVRSQAAIPDDEAWHHIAVVHQPGTELRFYVDGVLGDTVPYTSGVNFSRTQNLFSVGAEWNGALQFIGAVDRLKVSSGILSPEQLDSKAVPPAGAAGLTIGRPSSSPFGFGIGVTEVGGSVLDPNSISLSLNGAAVTPTSVTKSGATTTISYTVPGAPLPSGSVNTTSLTIKDTKGVSYTGNANFAVGTYGTLPGAALLPAASVDKTKKGFRIRAYQTDGGAQEGTIAYNEALLAGQNGPNIANLDDLNGVDANGYFTFAGVINFDLDPSAINGYFNDPEYPASSFPGIPGNAAQGSPTENFVQEILAALEFPAAGMYTMVVNTDWTGFPNFSDGFLVRAGSNPLNAASSVTVGFFDALAPAGPMRGVANSPLQFYVPQAGIYPFRLMYYQTAGGANLEWFTVDSDGVRTLINDDKPKAIAAYSQWTAPPALPTLSVAVSGGNLTLTFTGTLQSSDSVHGPWMDAPGSSPLTVTPNSPMKFYRARN